MARTLNISDYCNFGDMMGSESKNTAWFRFYERLNDFLPAQKVKKTFPYRFMGKPVVKDAIQALGVPLSGIDLILINGESVGFDHHLGDGDRVAVYPVFECFDISSLVRLRPMKRLGSSLIFLNDREQVLLFLRDDIPDIPYPNMWDVPGGHVEAGETPFQCIVREMKEEMGLDIEGISLFSVTEFDDRIEHVFWKQLNLDIDTIVLTEGQRLRWFSRTEVEETRLACGFNGILAAFFEERERR